MKGYYVTRHTHQKATYTLQRIFNGKSSEPIPFRELVDESLSNDHCMDDRLTHISSTLKESTKLGGVLGTLSQYKHYRLVPKDYGKPLEEFTDVKELMTVFGDALEAHREAYDRANILHGHISIGNIMIDRNGRGRLVDWDISRTISESCQIQGTWQFIACRLMVRGLVPTRNREDDFESFWHVLFWVALRCCVHGTNILDVQHFLTLAYHDHRTFNGYAINRPRLTFTLDDTRAITAHEISSPPLRKFLSDFQSILRMRYNYSADQASYFAQVWEEVQTEKRAKGMSPDRWHRVYRDRIEDAYPNNDFIFGDAKVARRLADPLWTTKLLNEHLHPKSGTATDWNTGKSNINHKALSIAQIPLLKRKAGSQYITDTSGRNDVDENTKNPRNKKGRMEPAYPSFMKEATHVE